MKTLTKGNVIVEDIKIGDIHYEFQYGVGIKCKVLTQPVLDENDCWTWQSENLKTGKIIDYFVRKGMEHYSANLYDYEAYNVNVWM